MKNQKRFFSAILLLLIWNIIIFPYIYVKKVNNYYIDHFATFQINLPVEKTSRTISINKNRTITIYTIHETEDVTLKLKQEIQKKRIDAKYSITDIQQNNIFAPLFFALKRHHLIDNATTKDEVYIRYQFVDSTLRTDLIIFYFNKVYLIIGYAPVIPNKI